MSDPLFDALRFFAYQDVCRAKAEKQSKTAWTEHLTERGREMADRLGIEITDFEIERKAISVARCSWANFKTVADIRRDQRNAEREMLARAKRKPPKPKQPKSKGSSWGWKKHIEQSHVADASDRWRHFKSIIGEQS
jgi:hypothetical protein